MNAIANPPAPRASVRAPELQHEPAQAKAPIVAAVDGSAASRSVIDSALGLAAELEMPLVFVYVRRGPASSLGAPLYQRRLTKAMAHASGILDGALAAAHAPASTPKAKSSRDGHGRGSSSSRAIVARVSSSSAQDAEGSDPASRAPFPCPPTGRWSCRRRRCCSRVDLVLRLRRQLGLQRRTIAAKQPERGRAG